VNRAEEMSAKVEQVRADRRLAVEEVKNLVQLLQTAIELSDIYTLKVERGDFDAHLDELSVIVGDSAIAFRAAYSHHLCKGVRIGKKGV